jgi:gamma-glutamyltranspeptidase/glutathione hydrolase
MTGPGGQALERALEVARMVSGPGRENGVVASGHCLASEAGAAVLKDGGNAVDAAVAAALVLTVVAPYATSLGGDVYMLVFEPGSGEVHGLNGTGRAPARAVRAAFGDDIPPSGFASVSVPGFLAGIAAALDRLGTRPLAALIGPARDLAADGFAAHATLARNVAARKDLLARDPEAAALFLPHGVPLAEGALLRQRDLAVVFDTIAREGPGGFYSGVAERIVADCEARGGLLGIADFASCAPLWQAPMSAPFFGHDVVTMPPNSYGMTLLFQLVDLAEQGARSLEPDDAAFLGAAIAARRAG